MFEAYFHWKPSHVGDLQETDGAGPYRVDVVKQIELSPAQYRHFSTHLLEDMPFITANKDLMSCDERQSVSHCLLVTTRNIRGGILSVDVGQTEAGRSLGLSAGTTMWYIVIPQAIKNVIPSIGNELIALIKETSIVSMIGMYDLTAAAKNIGSGQNLANYLAPMTVAALFYLAIVYLLTFIIKKIEGRLRQSDRR